MKPILYLCNLTLVCVCLWGCYNTEYSPMFVDNPKISIADITASYNRATIVFAPLNAGTISYAVTESDDPMPSIESFITTEAVNNTVVLPDLKLETGYRVYAYATSSVYEGEISQMAVNTFSTSKLISLNPEGKTANCYIIPTSGGCYKFNATVKGNSDMPTGDLHSAEVVWSDVANMVADLELLEDGHITFVAKQNIGNCVIAVKDRLDNILWSWHIWGTGGIPDNDVFVNGKGASYTVMDRNLGAYSSTGGSTCVVYQWGRKDPFSNGHYVYVGKKTTSDRHITYWPPVKWDETGDETHNNLLFTTENPATFIDNTGHDRSLWTRTADFSLWGDGSGFNSAYDSGGWSDVKSIYDPCPDGYRVGNVYTFSALNFAGSLIGPWSNGWWIKRKSDDVVGSWFPVTSSRDPVTGAVVRGALCEIWYSNPSGSTATANPRFFFVHATALGNAGTAAAAYGHAVRCVKHNITDSKLIF